MTLIFKYIQKWGLGIFRRCPDVRTLMMTIWNIPVNHKQKKGLLPERGLKEAPGVRLDWLNQKK